MDTYERRENNITKLKYLVRISARNLCRNRNTRQKQFGLKLLLFESSQPTREDSNGNIFEQNYFFFDFYFCTPKKYGNRCTVIHHYMDTYKRRENNITKLKYLVRISVRTWCRNRNTRQKQCGLKLLLFESSQPTREDSNSNIFEQNYFFFDFYFCTPKNMETDAQLYTIIWTLTKEEKITLQN